MQPKKQGPNSNSPFYQHPRQNYLNREVSDRDFRPIHRTQSILFTRRPKKDPSNSQTNVLKNSRTEDTSSRKNTKGGSLFDSSKTIQQEKANQLNKSSFFSKSLKGIIR